EIPDPVQYRRLGMGIGVVIIITVVVAVVAVGAAEVHVFELGAQDGNRPYARHHLPRNDAGAVIAAITRIGTSAIAVTVAIVVVVADIGRTHTETDVSPERIAGQG